MSLCTYKTPTYLVHKDPINGIACAVVPHKCLHRTVELEVVLLEAFFRQSVVAVGAQRAQPVRIAAAVVVSGDVGGI